MYYFDMMCGVSPAQSNVLLWQINLQQILQQSLMHFFAFTRKKINNALQVYTRYLRITLTTTTRTPIN